MIKKLFVCSLLREQEEDQEERDEKNRLIKKPIFKAQKAESTKTSHSKR